MLSLGRISGGIRLNFPVMPQGIQELTKITTKEGIEEASKGAVEGLGQLVSPVIEKGEELRQQFVEATDPIIKPIEEALAPVGDVLGKIPGSDLISNLANQDPTQLLAEDLGNLTQMPYTMGLLVGMVDPTPLPPYAKALKPVKTTGRATGLQKLAGPFPASSSIQRTSRGIVVKDAAGRVKKADPLAVEVAAYEALGGNVDELVNRAYTQAKATPSASDIAAYQRRYGISHEVATQSHHILEHSLYGNAIGQMKNKEKALRDLRSAGFIPGNTAWQMLDVPGGMRGSSHQGWFHSKQMNSLPARGTLLRKLNDGSFADMRYKDQIDLLKRTADEAELTAVYWMRWKESRMIAANPELAGLINKVKNNPTAANEQALRQYVKDNPGLMKIGTGEQPSVQDVMSAIYKKGQPAANPQLVGGMYTNPAQRALFQTNIRNQPGMTGRQRYLPLERNQ